MPEYPEALPITPVRGPVDAVIELPGSKSYTNRALLIAALAEGESTIRAALFSDDTRYMAESLTRLGVPVEADATASTFHVAGQGGRIPAKHADLFAGNSGTTARFLTAALALGHGVYRLDGVPRMRQRPIEPLLAALRQLGVDAASAAGNGCPPLVIRGAGLFGGLARLPGQTSSQYFSAMLMVGPLARDGLTLEVEGELVSQPYIDLTADTMRAFGAEMRNESYRRFVVPGGQRYTGRDYAVEPDASAASYFFALAAATGGRVRVANLGAGSAQGDVRFVDVLEQMGCRVERGSGYIEVEGPKQLRGVEIDMNGISDTVQTLAAIAPLAEDEVIIRNVGHIRHKETDRLAATAAELRGLGVAVEERDDGLTILPDRVRPGRVRTYDDHRMAMSFAILGCVVPGIVIEQPACVAKTFPDFFARLARATGESA
ncbi:MAG TPA: 3-phosphoshikimate 1-carboxyvinyltransferase [Thermomicrobiaceae bacterium]|nr:3-phosphoshikimate 1-carboxyvinyltransferase [Thermomicrobiaceae bacterium]